MDQWNLPDTLIGNAAISGGMLQLDGSGDYAELSGYAVPGDGSEYYVVI